MPSQMSSKHSRAMLSRDAACPRGGFYKSPTNGQSVDSMEPLAISWETACVDGDKVDLYLYAPNADNSLIMQYMQIDNSGTYNATLMPRWWNSTASETLQLTIMQSGQDIWMNSLPAGPVFTATYTAPSDGSTPVQADTSVTDSAESAHQTVVGAATASGSLSSHKTNGGKIAAAVLIPLIVIGLGILAFLKWTRTKAQKKSDAWNEKLDRRMSSLSQDWKPMSASSANVAIRSSMYMDNNGRPSFASIRPIEASFGPESTPMPNHIRPNYRNINSAFENRVSRVSFAADTRPSGESRRSRKLQGLSSAPEPELPPLPSHLKRTNSTSSISSDDAAAIGTMSPRQRDGALSLSNDEIKRRISQRQSRASVRSGKVSFDEVLPALSLMRTTTNDNDHGAFVSYPENNGQYASYNYNTAYAYASAVPPTPGAFATAPALFDAGDEISSPTPTSETFSTPKSAPVYSNTMVTSPIAEEPETIFSAGPSPAGTLTAEQASTYGSQFGGMQSLQAVPASFMSPDAMLQAYATRQSTIPSVSGSGASFTTMGTIGTVGSVPPTYSPAAPSFRSTVLGKGVGVGAGGISYPIVSAQTNAHIQASGRTLIPANPGANSPARGAYGVAE